MFPKRILFQKKLQLQHTFLYLKISGLFVSTMMAFYLLYYYSAGLNSFLSNWKETINDESMKGQKVKADGKGKK